MLQFKQVSYTYPDGHQSLKDISFKVDKGESVGIIGANGAGKSTLLYLLPGVYLPFAGEIFISDKLLCKKTVKEVRRSVGFIFQDSDAQLFTPTVYDDIAFGPRNMGFSDEQVKELTNNAIEKTGILHISSRPPYKLSGGEKKLAAIASVIAMEPEIIVMDEPSASLDPYARRKIINLLLCIEKTKIIASHDLDMIWDVCSRVIVLKNGHIEADGDTKSILMDEDLLTNCSLELPLKFQK